MNDQELANKYNLILHNDDVNDMIYIMACLMRYCKHTNLQAEQCAVIADGKGTCIVKEGDWIDLFDINQELTSLGIKVELKEDESNLHKS